MESLIIYLLKVSVAIALFYGLHMLLLRNETFFKWRRIYFFFALVFSLTYPLINFSLGSESVVNAPIASYMLSEIEIYAGEQAQALKNAESIAITPFTIFLILSVVGTVYFISRFLIQVVSLFYHLRSRKWVAEDGCKIVYLEEDALPTFSFFHWVVIHVEGQNKAQVQDIIKHEKVHAVQNHSIDVLCYELFCMLFWWNPFAWLMKKEMKLNLEYLADAGVVSQKNDYKEYQYTLLYNSVIKANVLVNNFNILLIKKRIIMMNKQRSSKLSLAKLIVVLPLALVLIIGNIACTSKADKNIQEAESPVTALVAEPQSAALVPVEEPEIEDDGKVYDIVEQMPRFPEGEEVMLQWVADNLMYPVAAKEADIQGMTVIKFVVKKDGNIGEVKVVRGFDPACDAEALRVVESMPKWEPGKQNGETVAVYYNLPIRFRLKK